MAITLTPLSSREVIRCGFCKTNQFRTANSLCRRCTKPLDRVEPERSPVANLVVMDAPASDNRGLQVASTVRDLRRSSNLSQRELATRMGVPRTYISKIENEKAMPTLGSLERLARALQVHVSVLLQDENTRASEEAVSLLADPFLAELLPYVRKMSSMNREVFLNQARELATAGLRRRMA